MSTALSIAYRPTALEAREATSQIRSPIIIDKLDLAVLTETTREAEDAVLAGSKDRAVEFVREIRAMAEFWRLQLA